jgi:hypothetical protein
VKDFPSIAWHMQLKFRCNRLSCLEHLPSFGDADEPSFDHVKTGFSTGSASAPKPRAGSEGLASTS